MIETRIGRGLLVPLHRGVYAVGHRKLRREGFWLAAVLAAGPGAVLSHRDAAALHGLRPANHARVDVTTGADVKSTARIVVHRTSVLEPAELTTGNKALSSRAPSWRTASVGSSIDTESPPRA